MCSMKWPKTFSVEVEDDVCLLFSYISSGYLLVVNMGAKNTFAPREVLV